MKKKIMFRKLPDIDLERSRARKDNMFSKVDGG